VLAGAQEEAERMGLGLLVMTVAQYPERNKPNLNVLKQLHFDGVIVTHSELTPKQIFELSNRSDFPLVVYGRSLDTPHVHCIDIDRDNAYYQATKYLINLGHQRIAFLSGPVEWHISQQRLKAIQRALAEADLTLEPDLHRWSVPTIDEAARIAATVLNLPAEKRPTAILGFNDLVAFGAMSAARSLGLHIPDDVSVIGSDDIYLASHSNPPLTSISQPHYRAGQLAVQKISNSLNGALDDTEGVTMLSCPLAVRESTGPCHSQGMA
jgi:DNA-binding LacI/PurR family transcriptional regulator